jgi:hypothetical protein
LGVARIWDEAKLPRSWEESRGAYAWVEESHVVVITEPYFMKIIMETGLVIV